MAIRQFNTRQLTFVIGTHIVTGMSTDSAVSVEMADKLWNTAYDSDGTSYRYAINNKDAIITVSLLDGSPSNDFFSQLYNIDKQTSVGVVPLLLKDNLGSTRIESVNTYIEELPNVIFSSTSTTREWVLRATSVGIFIGGFGQSA